MIPPRNLFKIVVFTIAGLLLSGYAFAETQPRYKIAIANYGPHPSLTETIAGLKDGMTQAGYKENVNVFYDVSDVSFQPTLIRQMLTKLKANKPDVMVVLTTPVAQAAKQMFPQTPLVFSAITDPVAAGLIKDKNHGMPNISGATDQQDLDGFITFAQKILPHAKTIGVLFSTAEDNDFALVKMLKEKTKTHGMKLVPVPIDNPQDIPQRTRLFKDKVDLIYVGASGPIQPSLPAIVSVANTLNIPVFNVDATAVKNNEVLGSFSVAYDKVGKNTANIVIDVLKGKKLEDIPPNYPALKDHEAVISQKKADQLKITLPKDLAGITVIK
ncbi:MAG: transporter [Gammaproteobacteria bacterium]|jgi:putative ABC transport system substrate-binding protein|nr:transporter [Gammaproteobacteria bacterium]